MAQQYPARHLKPCLAENEEPITTEKFKENVESRQR
jgi:hypothetical protein